ncbi:MAG: amidohydrolase family protein, partial [Stackebrandtia sp.]
ASGVSHVVGSITPGKIADLVLWEPAFYGAKPKMVIKGGMINWALMGDPNASLVTPQPVLYRPMYGASVPETSVTFVSQAAHEAGIGEKLGLRRQVKPIIGTRTLTKRHMVRNDLIPRIEVNPETFAVKVDGEHATVPPAEKLAMNQMFFFS